jgi:glycine/D-amino acid oxidase-like deaminating enzyme
MNKKIVIVGAGVAGINAATKLVDNGYPGELITIIDKGNDPHNRLPEEVMTGMLGAGGWSDGKLTYHTEIGGQLSKYCGDEKAMELMDQVINNFRRFHPKPEEILCLILKRNQNLLNHILDYVCSQYGILVQIIYMKLLKHGIHI